MSAATQTPLEDVQVRSATAADVPAILELCEGERLNPRGLDRWQHFVVAAVRGRLVGAVQMRRHADGARELGTLIVAPWARGRGVAAQLVEALLARHPQRVLMITGRAHAAHYGRWGFRTIAPALAPRSVRRNWCFGRAARVLSWWRRRPPNHLVILERAVAHAR